MLQPPVTPPTAAPPGFPEQPVTASELAAARAGVALRGGRIMGAMGVLAVFSALGGAAATWALWQSLRALPDWAGWLSGLQDSDLPPLEPVLLPTWAVPAALGLSLLATALSVWAVLIARRTVGAVRDQTLRPSAENAEVLERSARTVRPWITLGQLTPILSVVLTLGLLALAFGLIRQLAPQDMDGLNVGPLETGFIVLGAVVQSLPTIALTWLILAAVRRWLDAVVARARKPVAVRPAARGVEPWLLFTLVLLGLGLASAVLGGLPLLAVSAFAGAAPLNDPELLALGLTPAVFRGALLLGAAALLGGAAVYLLLTLLMGWSRGFAANVATVLDADLPGAPLPAATDPWSGPVQAAQERAPF